MGRAKGEGRALGRRVAYAIGAAAALTTSVATAQSTATGDLPPNFNPNSCYARVFIPPRTEKRPQEVVIVEGYDELRVEQPTFRREERTIVLRPAYERVEYDPPVFETRVQEVVIEPERVVYSVEPAKLVKEDQAVKIRERFETWDASCVDRRVNIPGATGEVLCRRTVPPLFKRIDKTVVARPAEVVRKVIPAKIKTIKVEVVVREAEIRRVQVPAKTTIVEVLVEATPFRELRNRVEPVTTTVPIEVPVAEGRIEWREILCRKDLGDRELVQRVQRALRERGYNAGPIDGVVGPKTRGALAAFQRDEGLPESGFTVETLRALGVDERS